MLVPLTYDAVHCAPHGKELNVPEIKPEVTLDSQTVYAGRLIEVHKDTVRLPNGATTSREIVLHPEVVVMLAVLKDGRLVMVRQYRKAVDRVLVELPAGGIDPGETAEDAVRREMIEETGYRAGALQHVTSFYSSPGITTELMHLYTVTQLTPGSPTEESDQLEVVLVTLEEALGRIQRETAWDAKTLLALLWYARSLADSSGRQ